MVRMLLLAVVSGVALGAAITDLPAEPPAAVWHPVGRSVHFDQQGRPDFIWNRDDRGRLQGPQIECSDSGEVSGIADYVDDRLHGLTRWWRADGTASAVFAYDRDRNLGPVDPARAGARPEGLCRPPPSI